MWNANVEGRLSEIFPHKLRSSQMRLGRPIFDKSWSTGLLTFEVSMEAQFDIPVIFRERSISIIWDAKRMIRSLINLLN